MCKHHGLKSFHSVKIRSQRGVALAETLLTLLPILLLSSLCIELARGYQVRHLLLLSLQQAARVAAVHHAAPHVWQPVLRNALSMLFTPAGRHVSPQARRDASCQAIHKRFHLPCWHAVALASTPETIHLRLTYLHSPMQEWFRVLLQKISELSAMLGHLDGQQHTLEQQAWRLGLIPMVVEYRVLRHRSNGLP
jgi:hypothetical protein